jgi:aminocarboxymuconate-semialdehyde decarboxylase
MKAIGYMATRLIYSGIFERYPDFPYIMAHTGGALLMALEGQRLSALS